MTDLVCFEVDSVYTERIIVGLERDYYKPENVFATGKVHAVNRDGFTLFMCPVFLPVGGVVGRLVLDTTFKGFRSSFAKKGISITKVKPNAKVKALYDELVKEDLGVDDNE